MFLGAAFILVAPLRPKAESKCYLSGAWRKPYVFMSWVWTADPEDNGETPRATPPRLTCTSSSMPRQAAVSSQNATISRNFHVVSTCSGGSGSLPGWKAFYAMCNSALESLSVKHSITGLRNSLNTSRMIKIASASSRRR